ncbi:MAG: D-sedoheptulose 7-phosphate isomerase [Nitrospirae bacterium YQR-1]
MTIKETIQKCVKDSIDVKERFFSENMDRIEEVAKAIAGAFSNGRKILLFGNGGSATDASHIAAEFVNRFKCERPGLPAIALNTDMAVITSIGNDYDFSEVFARQMKSLSQEGDIAVAISTSGGSKNVLKAVDVANKKKVIVIAFTGEKGVKLAEKSTHPFVVPSTDTARIQETHITLAHVLCQLVEEILFQFPTKKSKH